MTRIIALKVPEVKPTRRTARAPGRFGAGILAPDGRERRAPFTDADARWWAENSPTSDDGYEVLVAGPDWDALAREARASDRLDRGLCV